jgi:hypothetical protein
MCSTLALTQHLDVEEEPQVNNWNGLAGEGEDKVP